MTDKAKHTPGPWLIVDRLVYALTPYLGNNRTMAASLPEGVNRFQCSVDSCNSREGAPVEEVMANVRLIAAAPELLDAAELALKTAESWIHDQLDGTSGLEPALAELDLVRAAIAKAKGIA